MATPLPGLDVPVVDLNIALMTQIWYEYFQAQDKLLVQLSGVSPATTPPYTRIYQGLNAGSYDSQFMYFNPGFFSEAGGTECFASSVETWVDVSSTGVYSAVPPFGGPAVVIGGMAEGPPVDGQSLYFYAITRDTDNLVAILASTYDLYTGVVAYIPAGWTLRQRMRFSVVYKLSHGTNWNGLPNFFQDIDNTRVILSGAGEDSDYRILNGGTSTVWGTVSAANWLTDDNRTAEFYVVVSSTGSAGYAGIRPSGVGSGFFTYVAAGETSTNCITMKVDSVRNFDYIVLNATINVYLKSFWFDNPV